MSKLKVLIADDQLHYRATLRSKLQQSASDHTLSFSIKEAESAEEAVELTQQSLQNESPFDLVFLDVKFSEDLSNEQRDGHWASQEIRELLPSAVIVVISAYTDEDHLRIAEQNLFLTKFLRKASFQNKELLDLALSALVKKEDREGQLSTKIITCDEEVLSAINHIDLLELDSNLVIFGETGTGKELLAQRLNQSAAIKANQPKRPIVSINCGAVSDSLVESLMFGHKKGAFTGASEGRDGVFFQADGGEVFLDELQNASPKFQQTLMRALETREFTPVGSNKVLKSNFRVVCATNKSPEDMLRDGFLPDLIARLRQSYIEVPALRMRRDDVALLVEHQQNAVKADVELSKDALLFLQEQTWPTNVRGLKSFLQELFLHSKVPIVSRKSAEGLYKSLFPDKANLETDSTQNISANIQQQIETLAKSAVSMKMPLPELELQLSIAFANVLQEKYPSKALRELSKISGVSSSTLHRIFKKALKK